MCRRTLPWSLFLLLSGLLLALAVVACDNGPRPTADAAADSAPADTGPPPPDERCAAGTPSAGPRFVDATARFGIDSAGLDVLAGRVSVGDLDGDGYPDVIAHRIGNHDPNDWEREPRAFRYRVLMNVADGSGGRRFEDRTRESGYGTARDAEDRGRAAHFAVYGDLDDDGDLDIFSGTNGDPTRPDTDPGDRSEILLNDGTGTFTLGPFSDVIAGSEAGNRIVPVTSASLFDHDRDGLLDAFIGNWYLDYGRSLYGKQDRLARNAGSGNFIDITDAVGLGTLSEPTERDTPMPTYGVTACDVDQDGDTDLIVSAYGRRWNHLWLREGDGYREVGETSGFGGDDLVDYSDNNFYRCHCQITGSCTADPPNTLCDRDLWNAGVDDQPFRQNGNTFTTACADVDADGDMDLYSAEIVHWHVGSSSDPSELLVNEGAGDDGVPRFGRPGNATTGLEVPHVGGGWNEGGIASGLADLDNDGRMDALLGTSDYPDQALFIYRQGEGGGFTNVTAESGIDHPCAPGFALADLDRDGDLDLLVASSTARDCSAAWPDGPPLRVYENVGGQDQNWTQLHLEGAGAAAGGANRSAIGALVRVTAGGVTQTREVQGGYGTFGIQNDLDVTVGLGGTCAIDAIEVTWPDAAGTVERFENVRANYRIAVRQGEPLSYVSE